MDDAENRKPVKPRPSHVSQISHGTARKKIEVKVALLEFWGRIGIPWKCDADGKFLFDQDGEKILEYVPSSENEVRRWKTIDNSPGVIAQALEEMLNKNIIEQDHLSAFDSYDAAALTPGGIQKIRDVNEKAHYVTLKQNLNRALDALKSTMQRQLESANKSGLIAELNSRIKVMDLQRQNAAQQSLADRNELRDSLGRWKEKEAAFVRKETEWKTIIAAKDEQIAALETKIGELIKERKKVLGLSKVEGASRES